MYLPLVSLQQLPPMLAHALSQKVLVHELARAALLTLRAQRLLFMVAIHADVHEWILTTA